VQIGVEHYDGKGKNVHRIGCVTWRKTMRVEGNITAGKCLNYFLNYLKESL
jgi:hypothetical protein